MNRHQPSGRLVLGLVFAALTAVIWGALPIVTKLMLARLREGVEKRAAS